MVAVHPALHAHAKTAKNAMQDRKTYVETAQTTAGD